VILKGPAFCAADHLGNVAQRCRSGGHDQISS
jgi:hypothetical protein